MKYLLVAAIFLTGFLWLAMRSVSPAVFGYDEADYAFDAGLGWAANYTDTPTLPIVDFLREGLGRGKSASERGAMSEAIRQSNDIIFYRHWHGPLYFYWLIPAESFTHDEYTLRALSLAIPILSFLVISAGCLWLIGGGEGGLAAMLCSALFLWSWTTLGSTELAPHQLFACCSLLGLFCLAKMSATGEPRYLYAAAFAAGLAFCTLEVTFVLVATIIVCAFLERRQLSLDWRLALRAAGVFIATVFILWPGAILKLSFVKAYLFMAYLAVFRKAPWGNETLLETWLERFVNSPVEWIVIVAALGLFFTSAQLRRKSMLYPFLIFAGLMIGATLRVTTGAPRYALPFMPALQVFAGLVIAEQVGQASRPAGISQGPRTVMTAPGSDSVVGRTPWSASDPLVALGALSPRLSEAFNGVRAFAYASVLAAALFVSAWITVDRHPPGADTRLASVLGLIRNGHLESDNLLVPQDYVPSIHYYFPRTHLRGYTGEAPAPADLEASGLTGVLYRTPVRYQALLK